MVLTLCYKQNILSRLRKKPALKKYSLSELQITLLFMITEDNCNFLSSHSMQKAQGTPKLVFWKITLFYLKYIAGTYRTAELQKAKR